MRTRRGLITGLAVSGLIMVLSVGAWEIFSPAFLMAMWGARLVTDWGAAGRRGQIERALYYFLGAAQLLLLSWASAWHSFVTAAVWCLVSFFLFYYFIREVLDLKKGPDG